MRRRVVIVGGGFGGLTCAQALDGADVDITLVDRTNHHLFQPLLYQVAMAGLSPADIAYPIRSILHDQENCRVILGDVVSIDREAKHVVLADGEELEYDWLVLAAGAKTSYFGHDEWEKYAPGLKSLSDAIEIRRRVLVAFEDAERTTDPQVERELLTFAVIGGGPSGVELAGAIAELAKHVLAGDFRSIRPEKAHVILVEAGERILAGFPPDLSQLAVEQLEELGVDVRTGARVTRIDVDGVKLQRKDADGVTVDDEIRARTVLWGAGVGGTRLAEDLGAPLDRSGRVLVRRDTTIPDHEEIFCIGDMAAHLVDGKPLPGLSPVAMQQGRYVADIIRFGLPRSRRNDFVYFDKGSMATIGRSRAIAMAAKMHLSGFLAWGAWLFIHVWFLMGFKNRLVVMFTWAWSYLSYRRGARLITDRGGEVFVHGGKHR